jgi:endonuclease YncB( thermonuclease family)
MTPTYTYHAQVAKIVDADTVDLLVDLGFCTAVKVRIRLLGIDAPEMNTDEGKAAKAALIEKMPVSTMVTVRTFKFAGDKFGRWLGNIELNHEDINAWLVASKHAVYRDM